MTITRVEHDLGAELRGGSARVSQGCWRGDAMDADDKNCLTEMCSGSEEGVYLRLIDFCITQL